MANVTRISILELAFYGTTIPEERDFIPDELPCLGKAPAILQLKCMCVEQHMVMYRDS